MQRERDALWAGIADGTLEGLGGLTGSGVPATVTGISMSRKQVLRDDADAVQHRFRRDAFQNPPASLSVDTPADT